MSPQLTYLSDLLIWWIGAAFSIAKKWELAVFLSFYHPLNLENSWSILAPKTNLGLYHIANETIIR